MRDGEDCNAGDWREQNLVTTGRGTSVSATFCLRLREAANVESIRNPGAATVSWEDVIRDPRFASLGPAEQLAAADRFFAAGFADIDPSTDEFQNLRSEFRRRITPTLKLSEAPVRKELLVLPKADEEWADSEWWSVRLKSMQQGLVFLAGGWVFFWTLTWVVGWIVRGFLYHVNSGTALEWISDGLSSRC